MVRSFILSKGARQAVEDYLRDRPSAMSPQIRQIRIRAKKLDFETMESDIALLRRLAILQVPKGRKSLDLKASFEVKHSDTVDVKAGFTVSPHSQVLKEFMESGERISFIPRGDRPSFPASNTLKQRLNRTIERLDLPILASIRNQEVYLERTDIQSDENELTIQEREEYE